MNDQDKPTRRLRKRILWLVGIGGLAILAGMAFTEWPRWLFQFLGAERTPTQALLRVEPTRLQLYGREQSTQVEGKGKVEAYLHYLQTQIHLVNSKAVLDGALTDPRVSALPIVRRQTDPIAWLAGAIRVEAIKDTFLIRVAMEDGDPDEAYEILKSVIHSYMNMQKQYGQTANVMQIRALQDEATKLRKEIDATYGLIREIGQKAQLDEADPVRRGEYRQHLRQELIRIKLQIVAEKVRSPSIGLQKGQEPPKGEVIPTDRLKVLEAQLKLLEAELSKAADGERESLILARKIEKLELFDSSIQDHLREAVWQAGTENVRISIADPVTRVVKKPGDKEFRQGQPR